MERIVDADDNVLIECTNHACASNGGTNYDGLMATIRQAEPFVADDAPAKIQLNPDGTWRILPLNSTGKPAHRLTP